MGCVYMLDIHKDQHFPGKPNLGNTSKEKVKKEELLF
jgi:hypothetical protein